MTVYCATTNPGKLREFRMTAPDFEIRAISLPAPEERGHTFEENACAKALYYGAHADGYLFADDSGIEVDALGGASGVDSAHFDNAWLLDRMRGVENRTARFVCVIALVHDGALVRTFRGAVEARILEAPRGSNGFGYDPGSTTGSGPAKSWTPRPPSDSSSGSDTTQVSKHLRQRLPPMAHAHLLLGAVWLRNNYV